LIVSDIHSVVLSFFIFIIIFFSHLLLSSARSIPSG